MRLSWHEPEGAQWRVATCISWIWQHATLWNVILTWFIGWYLIYLVTGIHVQLIYIRSGLNFNRITIRKGHSTTKIRNLRLKLSWGSLLIDADKIDIELHSKPPKRPHYKRNNATPNSQNGGESENELDNTLSILPKNRILRRLGSFFLQRVPTCAVRLKSVTIKLSEHQKLLFPFSKFKLNSRFALKDPENLKFYSDVFVQETSYTIVHLESTRVYAPVNIDILRLQLSSVVNLKNGNVFKIKSKFLVDDLAVNVFESFKFLHEVGLFDIDNIISRFVSNKFNEEDEDHTLETDDLGFDRKSDFEAALDAPNVIKTQKQNQRPHTWRWLTRFYSKVEEMDIRFQNIGISDILLINFNEEFELKSLFETRQHNSLNLNLKGLSVSTNRIHSSGAGFFILFNSVMDYPFHFTLALQMLSIRYNHLHKNNTMEPFEIFNLPNFSISNKANVLNHLVNGKGFKDSVIEFYAATGSPTVDIDTQRLAILSYNILMLKKYIKVKQLQRLNKSAQALKMAVIAFENSIKKKKSSNYKPLSPPRRRFSRIMELLYQYYPRFNANVMIEQPRIIIRNKSHTDNKIHILTIASSQTSLHLNTTEERNYDITGSIQNLQATYSEKTDSLGGDLTVFEVDIFKLKTMSSKFMLYKNFMLSSHFKISETMIDMSQLRVISGINLMIDSFFLNAKKALDNGSLNSDLDSMIYIESKKFLLAVRHMEELDDENENSDFTSFKHFVLKLQSLPDWLLSVEMEISAIHVIIGSRSLLIPTSHLGDTFDNGLNFDSTGDSHKLKTIKMSLDSVVTKLSKTNTPISPKTPDSIHSISSTLVDNDCTPTNGSEEGLTLSNEHWEANILLSKLNVTAKLELHSSHETPVFSIPEVKGIVESTGSPQQPFFRADFTISHVNFYYDKYKLFIIFGAANLLREFFLRPLKSIKAKLNKEIRVTREFSSLLLRKQRFSKSEANTIFEMISWSVEVEKITSLLELADDFSCVVQSYTSKFAYEKRKLFAASGFSRVLRRIDKDGRHLLGRAFCIDNLVVLIDDVNIIRFDPVIDIQSDGIRIIQPKGSVVYRFFDNLSIQMSILKCLLKAFKKESDDRSRVVFPSESKPVQLPKIELHSKKIIYFIEDDPLEAEININYQLGLVEQRKRMELRYLFEEKVKGSKPEEYQMELEKLNQTMATSWIRKVKTFKMQLRKEIVENRKHLFGSELKLDPHENEGVEPSYSVTPLLTIIFENVNLHISKPKFAQNDLPNFINRMGSGVPYDSKYSVLLPMYCNLKVSEFRMHLRDYPLPLMHVPSTGSELPGLHLHGNIVFAEQLLTQAEHMREFEVSLAPGINSENDNIYYTLLLKKSLATVKIYTDMTADFDLDYPTRIVWGHSYQFGLQQVMMNFDQFSKPPVDPSKKLGFWDKIRFVMHGNFTLRSQRAIEVAFKGSNNPYEVLGTAAGFILSFEKNVKWLINKSNDSRDFFDITSDKVSWYIPNYLVAPLYVWSRESAKTVFLPASKEVIISTFGYYLNGIPSSSSPSSRINVLEKTVISLDGGVSFQVGFLLERVNSQGATTTDALPHYDILLWNPAYCEPDHDSYRGFRSDYIHMSISLKAANKKCYNGFHLSPGVFRQFFSWWKLFNGATLIPIRKGKLFGDTKAKTKFSQHLSTIKYLFSISSIFISHAYRSDASNTTPEDKINCIGLRAKLVDFVVDLHQRKEKTNLSNAKNDKGKTQRMRMNLGEVHLSNIDLRIMKAAFDQTPFEHGEKRRTYSLSDEGEGKGWYDVDDFNEVYLPRIQERGKEFTIRPLVFTKQFSYLRDTHSKSQFGNEENHSCTLFKSNIFLPQIEILDSRISQLQKAIKRKKSLRDNLSPRIDGLHRYKVECEKRWKLMTQTSNDDDKSSKEQNGQFHNKFILINMLFKWNNLNRNFLYEYISLVKTHSYMSKYLVFASLPAVEDVIENIYEPASSGTSFISTFHRRYSAVETNGVGRMLSSKERLEKFEQIMQFCLESQMIQEDYELEIISPQIQLQSEKLEDSVILITAPKIDGKIVTVLDNKEGEAEQSELETRYGMLLPEASILMINKSDQHLDDFVFSEENFGTTKEWPPWLGIEVCRDVSLAKQSRILVDKLSVMLTYDMLKPMGSQLTYYHDDSNAPGLIKDPKTARFIQDRLQIDCPKLVISCTSEQYLNLYIIVLNLLFYSEPLSKALQDQLEKLRFTLDLQNLQALYYRLCNLHKYYALIKLLKRNYMFRNLSRDNTLLNDYILLTVTENEIAEEIYLLMRCILTGDFSHNQSNFHAKDEWFIQADQIIFHLLEDDRTPIVDFAMAKGRFSRVVNENGSNKNKIEVGMVQGFNLVRGTYFSTLIQPFYDKSDRSKWEGKDFLTIDWTMNKAVGGIKILENFEINFQPLNVNLDAVTGEKLIRYIFGTDENIEESRLLQVNNNDLQNSDDGNNLLDDNQSEDGNDPRESKLERGSSGKKSRNWLLYDASEKSTENTQETPSDQVEEMIKRAGKYMSIGYFRVSPVPVKISIQLQKYLRVLNVSDFVFNFPSMEIRNQILSLYDITNLLKHSVIKTLWSHSGRLLLRKMTKSKKKKTSRQLKPIQSYEEFRDVHTISSLSL